MGNLCGKSYFLLHKHECSLCQENLNRGFFGHVNVVINIIQIV